jgi:ATP-binding cassette subfamily B multidrug efflux pump
MSARRALLLAVDHYRWRWVLGGVLSLAGVGLGLLGPWILRGAVDAFSGSEPLFGWGAGQFGLAIIGIGALEAIVGFGARFLVLEAARRVEFDLRNQFFAHLETLDGSFFDQIHSGDLMSRATSDLGVVRQVVGPFAFNAVNTLLSAAFTLAAMFAVSPSLSLRVGFVVPVVAVLFEVTR